MSVLRINASHRAPYRRHECSNTHAPLSIVQKKENWRYVLPSSNDRLPRWKLKIARKWRAEVNDRHQCLRRRLLKNFQLISCIAGFIALERDNKSVSTAMTIMCLNLHSFFFFLFRFVLCVFVTWQHYVAAAWLWCRSMRPTVIDIDAIGGAIHLCSRIAAFCWHPSYCYTHFLCCSFSFSYALTTFFSRVCRIACLFFFILFRFFFFFFFYDLLLIHIIWLNPLWHKHTLFQRLDDRRSWWWHAICFHFIHSSNFLFDHEQLQS